MLLSNFDPAVVNVPTDAPQGKLKYVGDVNSIFHQSPSAWHDMIDRAVSVTYRTFRKHCHGLDEWAAERGYGRHLHISNDYAVSYNRSMYKGKVCYYLCWSGFEYLWR
jgi:hypothetical protein